MDQTSDYIQTVMVITPRVRKAIATAYHHKCQYCGQAAEPAHVDHIIAKSNGGADDLLNYTLACAACNIRKRNLTLPAAYAGILLALAETKATTIRALLASWPRKEILKSVVKPKQNRIVRKENVKHVPAASGIGRSWIYAVTNTFSKNALNTLYFLYDVVRYGNGVLHDKHGCHIKSNDLSDYDDEISELHDVILTFYFDHPKGRKLCGGTRVISSTEHSLECDDDWGRSFLVEVGLTRWATHLIKTYTKDDIARMTESNIFPVPLEEDF